MPRLDHRVSPETALSYELRMVLAVLLEELNSLRLDAGQPPLTAAQVRHKLHAYRQTHPRTGSRLLD